MTRVVELTVAGSPEPWEAIGLAVVDGVTRIGDIALRFVPPVDGEAVRIAGWTLADSPTRPDRIDGLATRHVDGVSDTGAEPVPAHRLPVIAFDHLVVMTSSLERTCGAIEAATGEPLKRVREAGPVRQGFHRLGSLVIEVVESAQVTAPVASLWGFVFVVDDIHDAAGELGPELVSAPKPAVQPGRFIATFRPAAGLGLPTAMMSR